MPTSERPGTQLSLAVKDACTRWSDKLLSSSDATLPIGNQ
jgi:hypothetical protein